MRLAVGLVVYPVATVGLAVLQISTSEGQWFPFLALVPALAAGYLVARWWIYLVPIVGLGTWLAIAALDSDPCPDCEFGIGFMAAILLVYAGASVLALALGHIVAYHRRHGVGTSS